MLHTVRRLPRGFRPIVHFIAGHRIHLERLEPRFVFNGTGIEVETDSATLIGTADKDQIIVHELADGGVLVTGASNYSDGTVFRSLTELTIQTGEGDDKIVIDKGNTGFGGLGLWGVHVDAGSGDDIVDGSAATSPLNPVSPALMVLGGEGDDVILGNDYGNLSLDYSHAPRGIVARFDLGEVSEDGFGGHDTVAGLYAVTATPYDDVIHAHAHEVDSFGHYYLQEGNDYLDASAARFIGVVDGEGDDTVISNHSPDARFHLADGPGNDTILTGAEHDYFGSAFERGGYAQIRLRSDGTWAYRLSRSESWTDLRNVESIGIVDPKFTGQGILYLNAHSHPESGVFGWSGTVIAPNDPIQNIAYGLVDVTITLGDPEGTVSPGDVVLNMGRVRIHMGIEEDVVLPPPLPVDPHAEEPVSPGSTDVATEEPTQDPDTPIEEPTPEEPESVNTFQFPRVPATAPTFAKIFAVSGLIEGGEDDLLTPSATIYDAVLE